MTAPRPDSIDRVEVVVRAAMPALASSTALGGPAGAIASAILEFIPTRLSKRQNRFLDEVAERLAQLESATEGTVQRVLADEAFFDLLIAALIAASKTSHSAKLRALSGTVGHAAVTQDPDRDTQLLFVRYVDELTPSHLAVLRYFAANRDTLSDVKSYQDLFDGYCLDRTRIAAGPPSRDLFWLMIADLEGRGLLRLSRDLEQFADVRSAPIIISREGEGPTLLVTSLALAFLRHIDSVAGSA